MLAGGISLVATIHASRTLQLTQGKILLGLCDQD